MKQTSKLAIMALVMSFVAACNSEETKTESASTDSTATTTTMADTTTSQSQDMDAVKVAPGLYTVAKDTMGIRVLNVLYKPGDSSAMHSHPDYALYTVAGGTAAFYTKDGARMVNEMKTGTVNIRPAEFHSVKNIGKTTIKVILVEVSRPQGTVALRVQMGTGVQFCAAAPAKLKPTPASNDTTSRFTGEPYTAAPNPCPPLPPVGSASRAFLIETPAPFGF